MSSPSHPATMKALVLVQGPQPAQKGDPVRHTAEVHSDRPVPVPGEGQVLVKLHAASFNRRDEWSLAGLYPGLAFDVVMGSDGAGEVVEVGPAAGAGAGAQGVGKGDVVLLNPTRGWTDDAEGPEANLRSYTGKWKNGFGILGGNKATAADGGCFAEYVVVDRDEVAPVPKGLSAIEASAFPTAGVTAYRALFVKGNLARGHNLLITGVGGGVALLALQFAVAVGANVFVTSGSKDKIDRAVQLGAKGGVIYKDEKWPSQLASLLPQDRPFIDVLLDSAGGDIVVQTSKMLRSGARVVCYGMTVAPKMTFTMREVLKNVELKGSTMGSRADFLAAVSFLAEHRFVPVVDTVLSGLESADKGFELLKNPQLGRIGKVVIDISGTANEVRGDGGKGGDAKRKLDEQVALARANI